MVDAIMGGSGLAGVYAMQQAYQAVHNPAQVSRSQEPRAVETRNLQDYKPAPAAPAAERIQQPAKRLADEAVQFLGDYTSGLNTVGKAAKGLAGAARSGGADEMAASMQELVGAYNTSVLNMGQNAGRGAGVSGQLDRMAGALPDDAAMKDLGLTANDDGTLGFDAQRMFESLETQGGDMFQRLQEEVVGEDGFAARIAESARAGLEESAGRLLANDLAQGGAQSPTNQFNLYTQSGVQTYNNAAAAGVIMNFAV